MTKNMSDMDFYGSSRKSEKVFKIILSIIFIIGGLLVSFFSSAIADLNYISLSPQVLGVTGLFSNVVGATCMLSAILQR